MFLKRLDVQGFKSFAQPTAFEFSKGITAVIGPNGSGKSNIADALRWVLGEQSSRLLRAKKMEEVIFTGSGSKAPLGMAEVTITLDNSDHALPLEFDEIAITRRLYRSGESEFLLNRRRVRLRDLTELFLRANVGQNAYTVIGQGLIDVVLSLRPEERRGLIEEAANIKRHYLKIEDSQSKLTETNRNLARVKDIIAEIEPRLNRLRIQAERATEYQRLAVELASHQAAWYSHLWSETSEEIVKAESALRTCDQELNSLKAELEGLQSKSEALQVETSRLRGQLAEVQRENARLVNLERDLGRCITLDEERLSGAIQQAQEVTHEITGLEHDASEENASLEESRGRFQAIEEDIQAKKRLFESLQREAAELERSLEHTGSEADRLERACAEWTRSESEMRSRLQQLEPAIQGFHGEIVKSEEERIALLSRLSTAQGQRNQAAAKVETVESKSAVLRQKKAELAQTCEGIQDHLRSLELDQAVAAKEIDSLQRQLALYAELRDEVANAAAFLREYLAVAADGSSGVDAQQPSLGRLTELLEVPPALEVAIEAVLEHHLDGLVVEDWPKVEELAQLLSAVKRGRATLFALEPISTNGRTGDITGEGVIGVAARLVNASAEHRALLESLLGHVVIVEDLATARRLREQVKGEIVTLAGEVLHSSGAVTAGWRQEGAIQGNLARERSRKETAQRLETAQRRSLDLSSSLQEARFRLSELQGQAKALDKELAELGQEREACAARLRRAEDELQRAQQELEWRERLAEQTQQRLTEAQRQHVELQSKLHAPDDSKTGDQALLKETQERLKSLEATRNNLNERLAEAKLALRVAEKSLESNSVVLQTHENNLQRLRGRLEAKRARLDQLLNDQTALKERLENAQKERRLLETQLHKSRNGETPLLLRLETAEEELSSTNHSIEDVHARSLEMERQRIQAELQVQRHRETLDNLKNSIEAEGFDLETIQRPQTAPEGRQLVSDPEELRARVERLRARLRSIGPVDLDVVAEYEENKTRCEFLKQQVRDLEETDRSLREMILELQQISEREFKHAFAAVSIEFERYFSSFFGGGSARLQLTQPDDLSQTGIEIEVQPPGKRFQNLALLSGGERALTATALIFAVLQINPAPFCILDEVDAALDEANVVRFATALRVLSQRTQFIVVTHNRNTIDRADSLYGLTMGSDGVSKVISMRLEGEPSPEVALAS